MTRHGEIAHMLINARMAAKLGKWAAQVRAFHAASSAKGSGRPAADLVVEDRL